MNIDANGHDSVGATAVLAELDSLWRGYATEIYSAARQYAVCGQDAEDARQDAFEALLRTAAQIDNPVGWLKTVARRKAMRSRTQSIETLFPDIDVQWPVDNTSPEHRVMREASIQELLTAVEEVSVEGCRYVRYLAWGFTLAEIAAIYGTSVETIRGRIEPLRWRIHKKTLDRRPMQDAGGGAGQPRHAAPEDHLLVESVGALPKRQREVLGLALDGHRPGAIAAILGIASGNARTNLHHAKKKIAEVIDCPVEEVIAHLRKLRERMIRLAS